MNVCVYGGGALAHEVIRHYLAKGQVTAVCRATMPAITHRDLRVVLTTELANSAGSLGKFDALVTLAGKARDAKLLDMTPAEWQDGIDGNLTSAFTALHWGLPLIVDGGAVVVVGSIVGSTGGYGCANYAAAKAGLVGLVRAAANEAACRSVRVNLLELGYASVGMGARLPSSLAEKIRLTIPLRRFATAEEVVDAIEFLSRAYMTGDVLTLAGGLR